MKKVIFASIIGVVVGAVGIVAGGMYWYEKLKSAKPRIAIDIPALTTFREATNITYCSPGGQDQKLDLYIPENKNKAFPLLVYVHGGSWQQGSKDAAAIASYMPQVARYGYVVASIDYRLVPEHTFPAPIEDTKCAIRFLRANADKYNIDTTQVGVIGESAGGYLATMASATGGTPVFATTEHARHSDKVQAAVNLFGPSTFTGVTANTRPTALAMAFLGGTDPGKANISPYVTKNTPPMLLVHGTKDSMVPFKQAELLAQALEGKQVPHKLIPVEGAGHGLTSVNDAAVTPTLGSIQGQIIDFLAKYLKS
jgi:acetyl esterase/lipase